MKPSRKLAVSVGLAVLLTTGRVIADDAQPLPSPHVRLTSGPGELKAPDGQRYFLPVGTHILDGTSFENLEKETKRLQESEVRLTAENKSLKNDSGPGWGTLLIVALSSAALGLTVAHFAQ